MSDWLPYAHQAAAWALLIMVLVALTTRRVSYDVAAFTGLLLLGMLGLLTPAQLFAGFGNPALFTVAAVLIMSEGILASGIMSGLGMAIAHRVEKTEQHILALSVMTGLLSGFMNNVGAIGLVLPTAKRMASREGVTRSSYGLPLVYASIIGGSVTLIGTASNILVSGYRLSALGKPFRMFDFAAQGLAMGLCCVLLWYVGRLLGYNPLAERDQPAALRRTDDDVISDAFVPRNNRKSLLTLICTLPVIVLTSLGRVHSATGFGLVAMALILLRILPLEQAYRALNLRVLVFIGSMIGITAGLEMSGALPALSDWLSPLMIRLPAPLLIWLVVVITTVVANALGNTVAAVFMSPLVIVLSQSSHLAAGIDALLMAVAAGASLGLVLPTHQAALVTQSHMNFTNASFMRRGLVIALSAGLAATAAIVAVWV